VAKIRISVVQYLNSVPLAWGILDGPQKDLFEAVYSTPAECAQELSSGNVDIGLIPSIEYQRIAGSRIVPGPAIASRHRAASVLLLSKVPLARVRTVACDRGSRSSVALARVILNGFYRNRPEFREADPDPAAMLAGNDAALLIGDVALKFKAENKFATSYNVGDYGQDGPQPIQVFDLVERWNNLTGLPFVFAFWCARKGFTDQSVVDALVASREYGLANLDEIATRYAEKLSLDRDFLLQYLGKNMDYNMDRYGIEALGQFYRLAATAGAISSVRGIEFL
jgi:chorismate dehydratase